jgi:hypothetical protein
MPDYGSTDRVRISAGKRYIAPARANKERFVHIHSGEFSKELVQDRLLAANRFPLVCNALRSKKFLSENKLRLVKEVAPPSGLSSTVVFTYELEPLEENSVGDESGRSSSFMHVRGLLKKTYSELGGSERFHREERSHWR